MATVLIVDPDPATSSLLELLVLRLGHRPIGRFDMAEDEQPDLLLLEPASGESLRLARRLRRRFPRLPILCVSIDQPNDQTEALGCVDHVMKPFRRSRLELAIELAFVPSPEAAQAR